jgi:CheY-like chemotaxis protein
VPTTLLAIDDSVTMRKVLEMTFAGEDFRVVSAESADAAFAKLRSERPSIVLCDVTLEGAGGYAICAKIKAENPTVAVLLLASKQQPYDAHKGQSARADDFIEKPFDTQQLIDKVKRLATRPVDVRAAAPAAAPASMGPATQPGVAPAGVGVGRPPPAPAAPARAPGGPPPAPQNRPAVPGVAGGVGRSTMAYGAYAMQNPGGAAAPPQAPAASTGAFGARPAAPVAPSPPQPPAAPPTAAPHGTSPGMASPAGIVAASSAAAAAASASNGQLAAQLQHLGLSDAQVSAVLSLSREVIERVVWEVVPVLAETMIREELKRLTSE